MSTFHEDIRSALRQQLLTVPGIPATANIAVEGRDFTPPQSVPWVRESYKPGPKVLRSIPATKGLVRMDGLYLVDVFILDGQGTKAADVLVESIQTTFYPGLRFSYNGQLVTVKSPSSSSGIPKDGWFMVPVTVSFFAYGINP